MYSLVIGTSRFSSPATSQDKALDRVYLPPAKALQFNIEAIVFMVMNKLCVHRSVVHHFLRHTSNVHLKTAKIILVIDFDGLLILISPRYTLPSPYIEAKRGIDMTAGKELFLCPQR